MRYFCLSIIVMIFVILVSQCELKINSNNGEISRDSYWKILRILGVKGINITYGDKISFKALDIMIWCMPDSPEFDYCILMKRSNDGGNYSKHYFKSYNISDKNQLKPFVMHIPDIVKKTGLSGTDLFMSYHDLPKLYDGHCHKDNHYLFMSNFINERWWYKDECPVCDTEYSSIHNFDGITMNALFFTMRLCGEKDGIIDFDSQIVYGSLPKLPEISELKQQFELCVFNFCLEWDVTRWYTDNEIKTIGREAFMHFKYKYEDDQRMAYNEKNNLFARFNNKK